LLRSPSDNRKRDNITQNMSAHSKSATTEKAPTANAVSPPSVRLAYDTQTVDAACDRIQKVIPEFPLYLYTLGDPSPDTERIYQRDLARRHGLGEPFARDEDYLQYLTFLHRPFGAECMGSRSLLEDISERKQKMSAIDKKQIYKGSGAGKKMSLSELMARRKQSPTSPQSQQNTPIKAEFPNTNDVKSVKKETASEKIMTNNIERKSAVNTTARPAGSPALAGQKR
jgi:hypothetical protein